MTPPPDFNRGGICPNTLPPRELAAALRLTADTVRRLARENRIPAIRLSPKVIRFDPAAVAAALARTTTRGVDDAR